MNPIPGTSAGQGSGFSLETDVTLETFDLSPGAGGQACGPQFGLYGGGGGGGVLVEGKVKQCLLLLVPEFDIVLVFESHVKLS